MLLSRTVFGLELTCTRISAFVSDCKSSSAIKLRKMNKIERRNIKARSTKRHYWPRPLFPSLAGARIEQAAVPCTNDVIPGRSKMATACVRQAKSASGHKQDRFSTGEEGGGGEPRLGRLVYPRGFVVLRPKCRSCETSAGGPLRI